MEEKNPRKKIALFIIFKEKKKGLLHLEELSYTDDIWQQLHSELGFQDTAGCVKNCLPRYGDLIDFFHFS